MIYISATKKRMVLARIMIAKDTWMNSTNSFIKMFAGIPAFFMENKKGEDEFPLVCCATDLAVCSQAKLGRMSYLTALRNMHMPQSLSKLLFARKRLALEDAMALQVSNFD